MVGQIAILGIMVLSLIFFVRGRPRYDLVALLALLAVVTIGLVSPSEAFLGFGHPAVITVAAVLIMGEGIKNSGLVDSLAKIIMWGNVSFSLRMLILLIMISIVSAFMNNVGALVLFMPIAFHLARKNGYSPSLLLMPLAFASLLGGLITLIGTPPNIIIASFRAQANGEAFRLFDFSPVGIPVTIFGIIFLAFIGWRLLPHRERKVESGGLFQIDAYTTEIIVPEGCQLIGNSIDEVERMTDSEIVVIGLAREGRFVPMPPEYEVVRQNDILVIEASTDDLQQLTKSTKIKLVEDRVLCHRLIHEQEKNTENTEKIEEQKPDSECAEGHFADVSLVEAVVKLDADLVGKTVRQADLRHRFGINLLAIAREGHRLTERLRSIRFRYGDVLLLQGSFSVMGEALNTLGLIPVSHRESEFWHRDTRKQAMLVLGAAVGLIIFNVLHVAISFTMAAVAMVLTGIISIRRAYESIDWPVIVLLAAMIPIGNAFEQTGAANTVAGIILNLAHIVSPTMVVAILIVVTMILSNLINNAATAIIMAPIAISLARGLAVNVDPLLMAVAIGSSSPFLTPIGHQSNTLVMGPGGYHFADYSRMGLPLSLLVIVVAPPFLLWAWPL